MKSELAKKMSVVIFAIVMILSAFVVVAGAGDSSSQTIVMDDKEDTLAASEYKKTTDEAGTTGMYISSIPDQPGWPITTGGSVRSSPALGDIDGDGDIEIVVGSGDNKVYAWHHDGNPVTGWPITTGGDQYSSPKPALDDIDGDGDIEIVVGLYDNKVHAWHGDGTTVSGWPITTGGDVDSSPALGDIDGDGEIEIVVGSNDNKVYAWNLNGTTVSGWQITTGAAVRSSPTLGDIDGDGDIEVVIGSDDDKVYAWDCSGTYDPSKIEWGTFHHDVMRTGLYTKPPVTIISVTTDKDEYTIGETVYMTLEINRFAEYPVVTQLELELKEPCDTPDMLYKSPEFVMPAVFQWKVTVPMTIDYSFWVSGGEYSFIGTLRDPSTGKILPKGRDTASFKINDVPWMEKLKSLEKEMMEKVEEAEL